MGFYRKKPIVIEAIRLRDVSAAEAVHFLGGEAERNLTWSMLNNNVVYLTHKDHGTMRVGPDDWIIKGPDGELYPCTPDRFEAVYEPAVEPLA